MSKDMEYPLVSYQPLKFLYILLRLGLVIAHLPYWITCSILPACRPKRSWTFRQTLMNYLGRALTDVWSCLGITETLSMEAGSEGDRWQVLDPFDERFYVGPLKSNSIRSAKVGGTWYPSKPFLKEVGIGSKVVALHIHGGAFVIGNGRTAHSGFLAKTLVEHAQVDAVFCPQYRLSAYENTNPFPAALQDTLTSYLYLVQEMQIPTDCIVLSGDSAGANLAIALLRYLEEFGSELGLSDVRPSCAVYISPWVDPLAALGADSVYTQSPRWKTDYLPVSFLRWGAKTYAGDEPKESPYVTAVGNPYRTPVPMFVGLGQVEVLQNEGELWAQEMRAIDGNHIHVEYDEDAVHDTLLMGAMLGWEDNAREMARKIGKFIKKCQDDTRI